MRTRAVWTFRIARCTTSVHMAWPSGSCIPRESERSALRRFLVDLTHRHLSLPRDPDRRRLSWAFK
jgi:hypothetical protein